MINSGKIRNYLYHSSEIIWLVLTGALAIMGWILSIDGDELWTNERPIIWRIVEVCQNNSLYIYVAIAIIAILIFWIRRLCDPWIIEKLKFILNGYQKGAFAGDDPVLRDRDRVTIFKHTGLTCLVRHWSSKKYLSPRGKNPFFSRYLIPILRSGHTSQHSKAAFFAPDIPDKAEGVAGKAWATNRPIVLSGLPDLSERSLSRDKKSYAASTFTDIGMIEKYIAEGRKLPRSIAAIPLESCGRVWGVVVLDSANPDGVSPLSVSHYSLTVALIGELLEKM